MELTIEQLVANYAEGILMLDKDGYIQYSNEAVTNMTGFTREELNNKQLNLLYTLKEDNIRTEYELNEAIKKGVFVSEGWKLKKDGSKFWALLTISPIPAKTRPVKGFGCVLKDYSEQNREIVDLRKSEQRYRLMVEAVKDYSIFMLDAQGYIQTWNEGAQKLKGYRPEEIIGKHFSIFYIPADLESKKPERELKIAAETGKYEEEGWRVKKNGLLFWANVIITPLMNEQNILIGFSKVTRDLTDRKEKEEQLIQSEERYRSLVQQVTDYGIFMMDEKGRIVSWNEGARRIKGYEEKEIVGKYFSIFYPEEDILNGKPAHELKVARREGKYEEEGWRLKKDGSRFWANVVITAVYNTEGQLIGFSKVTRDLTERKAAERALRDSYTQYRALADELKHTNAELTHTNSELEQFTSIVSHDLQEPVRTIKSFLHLIEKKLKEKDFNNIENFIEKSLTASARMRELIQQLLEYSQLSRGEIDKHKINVAELIREVQQNLKSSIEQSRANIIEDLGIEYVEANKTQLEQLLQNLISNAIKFTDKENPEVKISCQLKDGIPNFAVSDNGIGIAKADAHKVFEIFRRLHNAKSFPGTGIGLAICKKIVERHGGRIWMESEPGKGTTFYFTLNEKSLTHA